MIPSVTKKLMIPRVTVHCQITFSYCRKVARLRLAPTEYNIAAKISSEINNSVIS